jgi:demethylmenaquinone methyltransferase/2-methoxy-6-polyprenyl-1,4-benzoquinol methylase
MELGMKNSNELEIKSKGLEEDFWRNIVSEIENYSKKGCYEKVNILMSLFTLKKLRIIATSLAKGSNVIIDAGSGPGTSTKYIRVIHNYSQIIAMDPSFAMIKMAKDNIGGINAINGMFENIPIKDSSADAIVAMFSFRDARNYDKALREFSRVLKRKGKLIILDLYRPESALEKIISFFQFNILSVISGLLMGCGKEALLYPNLHKTINYMYSPKEFIMLARNYFENVNFKKMPIIVGILYATNPKKFY